jgi:hypothetical protein
MDAQLFEWVIEVGEEEMTDALFEATLECVRTSACAGNINVETEAAEIRKTQWFKDARDVKDLESEDDENLNEVEKAESLVVEWLMANTIRHFDGGSYLDNDKEV